MRLRRMGHRQLMAEEDELAGVAAGLGLRDAAVVDLDFGGRAGEDDARGGGGAAGDAQALGSDAVLERTVTGTPAAA